MKLSYKVFLVDDQTGELTGVASEKYMRAYAGKEALPELASRTVRILTVLCKTENCKIVQVARITGARLQVMANGMVDQGPLIQHVTAILRGVDAPNAPALPGAPTDTAAFFTAEKVRNGARWNPTPSQIKDALNLLGLQSLAAKDSPCQPLANEGEAPGIYLVSARKSQPFRPAA